MSKYPIASFMALLSGDLKHGGMNSDDIVASEKAGRDTLISSAQLPKDGDWELLKSWGLEITGEAGELFYNAELPAGWSKQATDHDMNSNLVDEKGRKRANIIFYKAAFYDTRADITPIGRRFVSGRDYGAGDYSRDFIRWAVTDRARSVTLLKGSPVQYAFLTGDSSELGAIKDDLFHFSVKEEGKYGSERFTKAVAAALATPLTADDFYAQYHHIVARHDVVGAAESLAAAGMDQKINEILAGRDQWEID